MIITNKIFVIFFTSFVIQYFVLSTIVVNNITYITNSIGKAYIATILSLFAVIVEVIMHDYQYSILSLNSYAVIIFTLILFIYLYKKQIAITDKQYLEGIIENHSVDLLTSEEILKKTDNYDVVKIAKNIIQRHQDEIREIKDILK
jgi:hypothetical protein